MMDVLFGLVIVIDVVNVLGVISLILFNNRLNSADRTGYFIAGLIAVANLLVIAHLNG